jgi:hypothetical protein
MSISSETLVGLAAVVISLTGSGVYMASVLRGQTKPHFYSHFIWAVITGIAFFAQLHDHAGPGAWTMGVTALTCLMQAGLALRFGEKHITATDRVALGVALLAIAWWAAAHDPLMSVVLASLINAVAFYPTFRKSWMKPEEENLTGYNISTVKIALSIAALTNFTPTTTLYAGSALVLNCLFVGMCAVRRRALGAPAAPAAA